MKKNFPQKFLSSNHIKYINYILINIAALLMIMIFSCAPNPRIVNGAIDSGDDGGITELRSPQVQEDQSQSQEKRRRQRRSYSQDDDRAALRTNDVDFASAFDDEPAQRESGFAIRQGDRASSRRYPNFSVPMRPIRVMLSRNVREAAFVASAGATAQVRPSSGTQRTFSGRVIFETTGNAAAATMVLGNNRVRVNLPCTLFVSGADEKLSHADKAYRDALVIVGEGSTISVMNVINVEEYIRGVVPLEIGYLPESQIEAVKAQAVAARTYAYKRMIANESRPFDVVATVADQVYGGRDVEGEVSDRAVLLTKDLIMSHGDDIVHAFYHSTCGGRTAAIEDVWGGDALPYLRSIHDVDENGVAYCSASRVFTWTDTWTTSQLSSIIREYSESGNLQPAFGGNLRNIQIRDRFDCGRVKTLAVINANNREHTTGGDKVRFLLRRNLSARPILRSSAIREINVSGNQITINGGGHGHGIGMCQVGAIHRAAAGQTFDQILGAYYSGMILRSAGE